MIQCTLWIWLEWYSDPNDKVIWIIWKNELVEYSKKNQSVHNDPNDVNDQCNQNN